MKNISFCITLVSLFAILISCGKKNEGNNPPPFDPYHLTDITEREIVYDCDKKVFSDKMERRNTTNQLKINPDRNIPIDTSAFKNLTTGEEFVPRPVFIVSGNDTYKYLKVCAAPTSGGCDIGVLDGDNVIEYKYWTYRDGPCKDDASRSCKNDALEEMGQKNLHFRVEKIESKRVCKRYLKPCGAESQPSLSSCEYE